jgi:hypothetical protein
LTSTKGGPFASEQSNDAGGGDGTLRDQLLIDVSCWPMTTKLRFDAKVWPHRRDQKSVADVRRAAKRPDPEVVTLDVPVRQHDQASSATSGPGRLVALLVAGCLTAATVAGCSSSKATTANYCAQLKSYMAQATALAATFNSGTPDPATAKAAYSSVAAMLTVLASGAPSAIKTDVTTEATATNRLVTLLAKHDYDMTKTKASSDAAELKAMLADTSAADAAKRIDTYAQQTCGISTNPTTPPTSP